jgi:hypothetical protein
LNCHRTLSFCNECGAAVSVASKPAEYKRKSLPVPIPTAITVMVIGASMMVRRRPRSGANAAPVAGRIEAARIGAGGVVCPLSAHADDPCNGDPGCPRFGHLVCEQMDNGR